MPPMRRRQRLALWATALATLLGMAGLTAVLFAPIYPTTSNVAPYTGYSSLLVRMDGQIAWQVVWGLYGGALLLTLLAIIEVEVGGWLRFGRGIARSQYALWAGTGALLLLVALNPAPYLNLFMLPSLVCALLASALAIERPAPRTGA